MNTRMKRDYAAKIMVVRHNSMLRCSRTKDTKAMVHIAFLLNTIPYGLGRRMSLSPNLKSRVHRLMFLCNAVSNVIMFIFLSTILLLVRFGFLPIVLCLVITCVFFLSSYRVN